MHLPIYSTLLATTLVSLLLAPIVPPPALSQTVTRPATRPATRPPSKPTTAQPLYPDFSGTGRPSNRGRAGSRAGCQAADIPFVMIDDNRKSITTQAQPSFLVYLPSTASRFTEIRATFSGPGTREEIALPVPADRSRIVKLSPQIKRPLQINQPYNWQLSFYCGQVSSPAARPVASPSKPTLAAAQPVRSIGQTTARPTPLPSHRPVQLQATAPIAAAPESQAIVLEGTLQRRLPSLALRQALTAAKTDRDRYQAYAKHGSWFDTVNAIQPLRCITADDPALEQSWQQLLSREKLSDFAVFPAGRCKVLPGNLLRTK